jgi:hypothetical protein
LITEPEFCGGIAPAISMCLAQAFTDINKEERRRAVERVTSPGKSNTNGSLVVGRSGPCKRGKQCVTNRCGCCRI